MSTYAQYREAMLNVIDGINREPNEAQRLRWMRDLLEEARHEMVRQRNAAAYDLRCKVTGENAEMFTGISRDKIDVWVDAHRNRTGAGPIPRTRRDLTVTMNLSAGVGFPSQPPHSGNRP